MHDCMLAISLLSALQLLIGSGVQLAGVLDGRQGGVTPKGVWG